MYHGIIVRTPWGPAFVNKQIEPLDKNYIFVEVEGDASKYKEGSKYEFEIQFRAVFRYKDLNDQGKEKWGDVIKNTLEDLIKEISQSHIQPLNPVYYTYEFKNIRCITEISIRNI